MPKLSSEAESKLEELKQEYILSLPDKVALLEACWNSNELESLRMNCHKSAGSSASFGLPDISFAARTLQALCKTRLEHRRAAKMNIKDDKTLVDGLAVLLKTLLKNTM